MTRPDGSKAELEERRKRAVLLLELGMSVSQVANIKGVTRQSVYRWRQAYREEGMEGLVATPNNGGREPKLPNDLLTILCSILRDGDIETNENGYYTLRSIAAVIEHEFEVSISPSTVRRYIEKIDLEEQELSEYIQRYNTRQR